jgi:hypothetical protein
MSQASPSQKVTDQVLRLVVFTGLSLAVSLVTLASAQAQSRGRAQEICCSSPQSCIAMAQDLVQTCTTTPALQNSCNALHHITTQKWFLLTENAQTLPLDKKDMAGKYQLDLNTMKLFNDWRAGDAPGITRNGQGTISVRRVCVGESALLIAGRVNMFVSFEMEILSTPQIRLRNQQQVSGYVVQSGGERFFFTQP